MRNISKYICILTAAAALSGCDSYLDKMPDNRTELDTDAKIVDMMTSAYPTTSYAAICEFTSDNTDEIAGISYTAWTKLQEQLSTWSDVTYEDQDSPYLLWNDSYHAIASANLVLQTIAERGNPQSLDAVRAEALLCRAYNHFVLTNVFTKGYQPSTASTDLGVPYVTWSETTVMPQYDRGTVADDYAQMARDIEEALPLVSSNLHEVKAYHFNKKAAYAFATRFWLYYVQPDKSNYDKAIAYATQVLGEDPSSALRDWASVGGLSPNGNIRQTRFVSTDEQANLLLESVQSYWPVYYGPYGLAMRYVHGQKLADTETCNASALWGSADAMHFTIPSYQGMTKVIMPKMGAFFEVVDAVSQIGKYHMMFPAFLADEVILNRAEAYTMKGQYDLAAADLNTFVHKFTTYKGVINAARIAEVYGDGMAYYTPTEPTPKKRLDPDFTVEPGEQEQFIQAILHTRRILTLHEGLRWFDVKRYGITIYRRTYNTDGTWIVTDTMTKDDPRRAIQLPPSVIRAGLTANPR